MRNPPVPSLLHIDLTAMIDVIFLLLIFWMMVARMSDAAQGNIEQPVSESAALERSLPQVWTVDVPDDATGRVRAAGRWMDVDELSAVLADQAGSPAVLVRADARVDAARVQAVLAAIGDAGVARVGLAVREPQP